MEAGIPLLLIQALVIVREHRHASQNLVPRTRVRYCVQRAYPVCCRALLLVGLAHRNGRQMPVQNGQEVGTKDGGLIIPMQRRAELRLNREEKVRLSNLRAPLDAEGADQMVVQPLFGLRLMQVGPQLPLLPTKLGMDLNGVGAMTVLIFILMAKVRRDERSLAVIMIKMSLTDALPMIKKEGGNPTMGIGMEIIGENLVLLTHPPLLPHRAAESMTLTGNGGTAQETGHRPKNRSTLATKVEKEAREVHSNERLMQVENGLTHLGTGIAAEVGDRGREDLSEF